MNFLPTNFTLSSLKSRDEKIRFIDKNIVDILSKVSISPTAKLRLLDTIRYHTPNQNESDELNLPSTGRLNMHSQAHILWMCGGGVGIRFTGEELNSIITILKKINILWSEIEKTFNQFDNDTKKMPMAVIESDESIAVESMKRFQSLCDEYCHEMISLQNLIKLKQEILPSLKNSEEYHSFKFESDPEKNIGKKLPDWLTILLQKYYSERMVDGKKSNSVLNISQLAIFLSECVTKHIPCNKEEAMALTELVQASNDISLNISNSDISDSTINTQQISQAKKYWANRLYKFLRDVTELKTAISDDSALQNYE